GHVVRLVVAVQHRRLRITTHAGGAHLVDREPRLGAQAVSPVVAVVGLDLLAARRLEHLGRRRRHVLAHRELVVAPGAVDAQERDTEFVRLIGELHVVVGARQALPKPRDADPPAARIPQPALEPHAEPPPPAPPPPPRPPCAALLPE